MAPADRPHQQGSLQIMVKLKTQENKMSVLRFLKSIKDPDKRKDCFALLEIMKTVTKEPPKMWGTSIVGFGSYHYKYESGREGDWFLAGFSPRKQALTLYIMSGFPQHQELLKKLGKYKTGKSCLYVKRLQDVHVPTLKRLFLRSVAHMRKASGNYEE